MRTKLIYPCVISLAPLVLILMSVSLCDGKNKNKRPEVKSPVVTIPTQGQVQGIIRKSRDGRNYFAYLGIPFAAPPQQRFKNPEPPSKWDGLKDGSEFGSECVQVSATTGEATGSEDCLFLNVFTPNLQPDKPYSTIVFIHGGGFQFGSGGQYGVEYFMDEDVILVTFNYRLGPFGFLNTDDGVVDANVGLKDQTMAMTWVKNNIKAFGGSEEMVTIFGGSAGAAAVSYQIVSPMSKGLFQRAISGSGTVDCPWALIRNPREFANSLASQFNCPTEDSAQMIACLRSQDAYEFVVDKSFTKHRWALDPMAPFAPSIEFTENVDESHVFLPDDPAVLLEQGKFHKVPWLTGVTTNEGLALHAAAVLNDPSKLKQLNDNWSVIAPITLTFDQLFPEEEWTKLSEKIRKFYFGEKDISNETGDALEQLYSDRNFFHGSRRTILAQAKQGSPVYPYFFDYKGIKSWMEMVFGFKTSGVAHADDFAYYFKFYMDPNDPASGMTQIKPNSEAEEMSKKLVKMIVGFAETGKPLTWGEEWPMTSMEEANGSSILLWYHLKQIPSLERETEAFITRITVLG